MMDLGGTGKNNIGGQLGLVSIDLMQQTVKKHVYSIQKHIF
jgi:hypothetical protein